MKATSTCKKIDVSGYMKGHDQLKCKKCVFFLDGNAHFTTDSKCDGPFIYVMLPQHCTLEIANITHLHTVMSISK